ncbi:hypothetical protein [Virgibacillus subterraneus]|nr:hypothetical protein [Virgibacillus subterraneus]
MHEVREHLPQWLRLAIAKTNLMGCSLSRLDENPVTDRPMT